jgi:hypothetical protein
MTFWKKIISDCKSLSLDCHAASRAQSEKLDHPLPPAARVGLWIHLRLCQWCRRYGRQVHFLGEAARNHPEKLAENKPLALSAAARERIKQRLVEDK